MRIPRRKLRRIVRDEINDYLDSNPQATQKEAIEAVGEELRTQSSGDWIEILLNFLREILPILFELRNRS